MGRWRRVLAIVLLLAIWLYNERVMSVEVEASICIMGLLHRERVNISHNLLLLSIMLVLNALMESRQHWLVLMKPGSSKKSSVGGVYVDDIKLYLCLQFYELHRQPGGSHRLLIIQVGPRNYNILIFDIFLCVPHLQSAVG